jgi:hypothetical protein
MAWVSNVISYHNIKDQWDMDTCIKFLMLSETTQKRLRDVPPSHKACAVKDLVCHRIRQLLAEKKKPSLIQKLDSKESDVLCLITVKFIDAMNVLLMIFRHAYPTYPNLILPLPCFTTPARTNADMKLLQQQLLNLAIWMDTQARNAPVANGQTPPK